MENNPIYTKEDVAYVQQGVDDPDKAFRKSVIDAAIELNGANDNAQPGVAVSYIPEDNYYIRISVDNMPDKMLEIYEQAMNWHALGRGKGGLAGASVRWRLRTLFDPVRESKIIKVVDETHKAIVREFIPYLNVNKNTSSVWFGNSWNVVGLATSCFIRESHHWDANNLRPIKALLGSLNQDNEIAETEYRKLFYLSIHPLPLEVLTLAYFKSLDPDDRDISATVKTRLNVAPAGYAAVSACAIAAESFIHEDFAKKVILIEDIKKVLLTARQLKLDPISYHPFAVQLGQTRKELSVAPLTEAMIVLGAYAKSCIGGTLANSPALIKFLDTHARKVNKLVRGFNEYNERKSDDLMRVLTGTDSADIDVVGDKVRPLAKLAERLKNMSGSENSPVYKAAERVEEQIAKVVGNIADGPDIAPLESMDDDFYRALKHFMISKEFQAKWNISSDAIRRVASLGKPVDQPPQ